MELCTFWILRFLANSCTISLNFMLNLSVGNSKTRRFFWSISWTKSHICKAWDKKRNHFANNLLIICYLSDSSFLNNCSQGKLKVLIHLFVQIIVRAKVGSRKQILELDLVEKYLFQQCEVCSCKIEFSLFLHFQHIINLPSIFLFITIFIVINLKSIFQIKKYTSNSIRNLTGQIKYRSKNCFSYYFRLCFV